jgi:hypothetical protein
VKKEGEGLCLQPALRALAFSVSGIDPGNSLYFNAFFLSSSLRGRKAKPMKPFDPAAGCMTRNPLDAFPHRLHLRRPALIPTLA